MLDYTRMKIKIYPPSEVIHQQFKSFLFKGFLFTPVSDKGRVYYISYLKGLRLKIFGDVLFITGSLCKAYHGFNDKNFTFKELNELKRELENVLEVPASLIQVTRMEYGLVSDVTNSGISFLNFGKYKSYHPEKIRYNGLVSGIDYENSTHRLKLYDKTKEARKHGILLNRKLFRIEKVVSLSNLRKSKAFSSIDLRSLEDLCRLEVQWLLFQDLIKTVAKIEFLDLKKIETLTVRELRVYSYMNHEAIRKVVSKKFNVAYKNDKKVYQKCLQKLESKTFQKFLKQLYKINESLFPRLLIDGKKGTINIKINKNG